MWSNDGSCKKPDIREKCDKLTRWCKFVLPRGKGGKDSIQKNNQGLGSQTKTWWDTIKEQVWKKEAPKRGRALSDTRTSCLDSRKWQKWVQQKAGARGNAIEKGQQYHKTGMRKKKEWKWCQLKR